MAAMTGVDDLDLLRHATDGNDDALNEILLKYREKLHRMIATRMNPKLQGRLDASDVIQDTYIEAARALDSYLTEPKMSVYLWLRHLAGQKLIQAHRRHLGASKRDANRENRIYGGAPSATSQSIAIQLAGQMPTPSQAAMKNEAKSELVQALNEMSELDREVLTLRHFEHLNARETAELLGLSLDAVKKRYIRALDKLYAVMSSNDIDQAT